MMYRKGLGAPADWQVAPDNSAVNPKYINYVLMPDGSTVPIESVYDRAPSPAVLDEWKRHAAQYAWAFVASPNPDMAGGLVLQYNWTGNAPATGEIAVTGGAGTSSGAVQLYSGTVTPTNAYLTTSDQQPAPLTIAPPTAPTPSNAFELPGLELPGLPRSPYDGLMYEPPDVAIPAPTNGVPSYGPASGPSQPADTPMSVPAEVLPSSPPSGPEGRPSAMAIAPATAGISGTTALVLGAGLLGALLFFGKRKRS